MSNRDFQITMKDRKPRIAHIPRHIMLTEIKGNSITLVEYAVGLSFGSGGRWISHGKFHFNKNGDEGIWEVLENRADGSKQIITVVDMQIAGMTRPDVLSCDSIGLILRGGAQAAQRVWADIPDEAVVEFDDGDDDEI